MTLDKVEGTHMVMEATHRFGLHTMRPALTLRSPSAIDELNPANLEHIFLTYEK